MRRDGQGVGDAMTHMPGTSLTREQVRLVSCPTCGAGSTDKCSWPGQNNPAARRQLERIHGARAAKAQEYRRERRI